MDTENNKDGLACKLSSSDLQKRKETVIEGLKKIMVGKEETEHGYRFKFPGTESVLEQLNAFIKTESECCSFFVFYSSAAKEPGFVWLEITGAQNVKEFINAELSM